jgi:hypothetical protein
VLAIDRERVGRIAQGSFEAAKAVVQAWLIEEDAEAGGIDILMDELWAALHGMAALYLDRSAAFESLIISSSKPSPAIHPQHGINL